ncbi:hypothetical protein CKO15_09860 [Halorhodospira abdelmalekii]|uniref:helix-turn-helix domain-containing protein n=1 Tax=Halorhodospira abdelmalekii TaxID=421629 RepID=UPI001A92B3E6|nr:helix-turn-helix transcriptional regulator [Halorhodospira abdelmalekii]MBK1735583.1 hypothetical protein [Halorhodospira abdelmalekii]
MEGKTGVAKSAVCGGLPVRLKTWRKSRGLTQHELGALIGAKGGMVSKYEVGLQSPGSKVLEALAQQGVDVHWLVTGEPAPDALAHAGVSPRATAEPWPQIVELVEGIADAQRREHAKQQLLLRAQELAEMDVLHQTLSELRGDTE